LELELPEWGKVPLADRGRLHVVAPVQASLAPLDDLLLDGASKSVDIVVTSRAPRPIAGTLRVLGTSDWQVTPARAFEFTLRRPGQTARARVDLRLPGATSPGPYELAVRLDVEGEMTGTLRTTLVRPMEWVLVGPFAPPAAGGSLPPESGASIGTRYAGIDGRQIAWRIAPRDAYDPDGGLDLEALFPDPAPGSSACALTVLEAPEPATAVLHARGVERAIWNGVDVPPDGRVPMLRGRNTLLVRSRAQADGWRVTAQLRDPAGEPLRVVTNDLSQLLDGYADLEHAPMRPGESRPPDRVVVVRWKAAPRAKEVAILGTFNAWVPLELQRQPDGSWQRELRLRPGRYAYKLLVDGHMRPDPASKGTEPDGFGGRNSLLVVQ
jgi:hypothetical protein